MTTPHVGRIIIHKLELAMVILSVHVPNWKYQYEAEKATQKAENRAGDLEWSGALKVIINVTNRQSMYNSKFSFN